MLDCFIVFFCSEGLVPKTRNNSKMLHKLLEQSCRNGQSTICFVGEAIAINDANQKVSLVASETHSFFASASGFTVIVEQLLNRHDYIEQTVSNEIDRAWWIG